MNEISFLNFGLILALVPICQGLVQVLKTDSMPSLFVRWLSLFLGIVLVFLVKLSNVEGISELIDNPFLAALTGIVVALISSGAYDMTKRDIVTKIAQSTSDVIVPSELVDVKKEDPASIKSLKQPGR